MAEVMEGDEGEIEETREGCRQVNVGKGTANSTEIRY